jgi:hypothetical protein
MPRPLILYSCCTWLAYMVSQKYYGALHYVWCTPHFDPNSPFSGESAVPPTSSPREIYANLHKEIARGDRHSEKIAQNKLGILRGANIKRKYNVITVEQRDEITTIVKSSQLGDYRPLLFVIPFAPVAKRIKQVPIRARANPLSEEYILENLKRSAFDVLEIQ